MKSMKGRNSNFAEEPEDEWNDYGPRPNFGNFRNERYSNAYGDYRGGYGPMNSGGFGPMNGGGFGPMNSGGFGPPRNMGPPPGNFGPRPLFPPGEIPFMMGRGFGPRGPNKYRRNDDKTVRYLMRCGVGKEHLKNLPRALLQLIEPQHCGLCAQSFNSFAISRTHYGSKNHLKNQKKWLSQHSDAGYQQAREIPFKSRELYCELCDVHITSKSHAESHYAGKPHRAIVEGRKMPRNPALLQRSMSTRLEQLIRREKKNLKPIDDGDVKEEPKEAKSFQSELYCDICKTSVTCTEQMTMHLNGKRHLSKEKQHILKMMKGDTNEDKEKAKKDDGEDNEQEEEDEGEEGEEGGEDENEKKEEEAVDEDEEVAEGEGEEAEGEQKGGGEGGEDDFDWGNGSGTWDEPETKW